MSLAVKYLYFKHTNRVILFSVKISIVKQNFQTSLTSRLTYGSSTTKLHTIFTPKLNDKPFLEITCKCFT